MPGMNLCNGSYYGNSKENVSLCDFLDHLKFGEICFPELNTMTYYDMAYHHKIKTTEKVLQQ
jgi:hypothetical protein